MTDVFIASDNIVSPLGHTSAENFEKISSGISAIERWDNASLSETPFFASLFDDSQFSETEKSSFTKFEQLLIASIKDALAGSSIEPADQETVLIVSTTKGNITLLEDQQMTPDLQNRIALHESGRRV